MIKELDDGFLIVAKTIPNSSKNDIIIEDDFIKIKVTAQAIENKANEAIIEFISKQLKIPKRDILIIKGLTSREKTIFIKAIDKKKRSLLISELTKNKEKKVFNV